MKWATTPAAFSDVCAATTSIWTLISELAKSRSNDNPVYYIQHAHARVASVLRQLESRGLSYDGTVGLAQLSLLTTPHEAAVLTALDRYPEIIRLAGANRAPHALVHYLRELANSFHTYYNAEQFIVDDAALRNARLSLVLAVRQVIRNGLTLLGVSAPTPCEHATATDYASRLQDTATAREAAGAALAAVCRRTRPGTADGCGGVHQRTQTRRRAGPGALRACAHPGAGGAQEQQARHRDGAEHRHRQRSRR
jgi:hypothetical protein